MKLFDFPSDANDEIAVENFEKNPLRESMESDVSSTTYTIESITERERRETEEFTSNVEGRLQRLRSTNSILHTAGEEETVDRDINMENMPENEPTTDPTPIMKSDQENEEHVTIPLIGHETNPEMEVTTPPLEEMASPLAGQATSPPVVQATSPSVDQVTSPPAELLASPQLDIIADRTNEAEIKSEIESVTEGDSDAEVILEVDSVTQPVNHEIKSDTDGAVEEVETVCELEVQVDAEPIMEETLVFNTEPKVVEHISEVPPAAVSSSGGTPEAILEVEDVSELEVKIESTLSGDEKSEPNKQPPVLEADVVAYIPIYPPLDEVTDPVHSPEKIATPPIVEQAILSESENIPEVLAEDICNPEFAKTIQEIIEATDSDIASVTSSCSINISGGSTSQPVSLLDEEDGNTVIIGHRPLVAAPRSNRTQSSSSSSSSESSKVELNSAATTPLPDLLTMSDLQSNSEPELEQAHGTKIVNFFGT